MNKSYSILIIMLLLAVSCAGVKSNNLKQELVRGEERFSYTDKNGSFLVKLGSGINKKDNTLFTKRSLEITDKQTDNILEQSIVLSEIGVLKKKKTILRPKVSQYTVWFDGKKYFSELKLNQTEKLFDLKMASPESQWNGTKKIKLPNSKALYCFFSQVIECAKAVDFIATAIKKEGGSMNFYIVWEGYPYLNETFSDFPVELFSKAKLEYDGKTKEDERRFNLSVAGQSIFFVLDKNEQMKKMFWVSQGISMVSRTIKESDENKPERGEGFE